MRYEQLHLNDYFPALRQPAQDPLLSVYLPDNLSELEQEDRKRPCLLVCPGGGYEFCSQREAEPIALHFLPEGFNVFVLWYSCAPHRFPTQLCEVAAALELMAQQADRWHCDLSRTAIMGFSAGGHLAAHYANAFRREEVRTVFPESRPVQASILCYPVITADPQWAHAGSFDQLTGHSQRTPDDLTHFSCDRLVSHETPPAFLWHTAEDSVVPVMNTLLYAQSLAAHHIPFELHIYPRGGHGMSCCDYQLFDALTPEISYAQSWLDCAKKWLRTVFSTELSGGK